MLSLFNPFLNSLDLAKTQERKNALDQLFNWSFDSGVEYKKEQDGNLVISIDVPGVKEENISVEVSPDNMLTVSGERRTATSSCSINKSFSLGDEYDLDTLKAELQNGVLNILLVPKQLPPAREAKRIPITSLK